MPGPFIWGPEGSARSIASGSTVSGNGTALSGNGEKNYVTNHSAVLDTSGWAISGAGTLARDTSASLPRKNTTGTGFAFTSSTDEEYARCRFTLDQVDNSKKLKALLAYAATTANFRVEVWKNSASDYSGSYTEFSLTTDSSGDSYLPATTTVYPTTFHADTTDYLELRLVHNGTGTDTIYFSDVIVGPGIQPQGAVVGPWQTFTGGITNLPVTSSTFRYRRVGSDIQVRGEVIASGAATGTVILNLPSGLTFDTAALSTSSTNSQIGVAYALDAGTGYHFGPIRTSGSTTATVADDNGSGVSWNASTPFTWASTDQIHFDFSAPIAEWAGSGTVNLAQNDVEYAFNSSTSTTSDTTSFGYGPAGVTAQAFAPSGTNSVDKRVRFQRAIQAGESLRLEFYDAAGGWIEVGSSLYGFVTNDAGTTYYGARLDVVSSTDVDVVFYSAPFVGGSWSTSIRWRVVKVIGGQAVGFGAATATSSGLVSYEDSGIFTANFNTGMSTATNNVTVRYSRVGKTVTLTLPQTMVTATATSGSWTATSAIPAALCPSGVNIYSMTHTIDNNATDFAAMGSVYIGSTGTIQIIRNAGNWASATTNCGFQTTTFSYAVA